MLLAYIQEKIETEGYVCYIPYTNTGYVRNHCRRACFERYKLYRNFMRELTLEPDEYSQLNELNKKQVYADVLNWIEEKISK